MPPKSSRPATPRQPKRAKSERTKARIFEAALAEFSARGLEGARIHRIAAGSGTNKERIYWFYGSKVRLYEAVLRHAYAWLADYEKQFLAWDEAKAGAFAGELLRAYFRFHEKHPDYWRLISWENLSGGKHAKGLSDLRREVFRHLRKLFGAAQARGRLKRYPSFETFLHLFFASSFFYYSNRLTLSETLEQDLADPVVLEKHLDELARVLSD